MDNGYNKLTPDQAFCKQQLLPKHRNCPDRPIPIDHCRRPQLFLLWDWLHQEDERVPAHFQLQYIQRYLDLSIFGLLKFHNKIFLIMALNINYQDQAMGCNETQDTNY